jgi:hypothetical protein
MPVDRRGLITRIAIESEGLTGFDLADICGLEGAWKAELGYPYGRIVNGLKRGISTCGLVAEGVWWMAGIAIPKYWRPYAPKLEVEKAIARAHHFASKCGAVVKYDGTNAPMLGDYVVIGTGLATHALTFLELDGDECVSIDGGQVDEKTKLQTIKLRRRPWVANGLNASVGGRVVQFWIDVDRLPSES